jgi:hypothetical protein
MSEMIQKPEFELPEARTLNGLFDLALSLGSEMSEKLFVEKEEAHAAAEEISRKLYEYQKGVDMSDVRVVVSGDGVRVPQYQRNIREAEDGETTPYEEMPQYIGIRSPLSAEYGSFESINVGITNVNIDGLVEFQPRLYATVQLDPIEVIIERQSEVTIKRDAVVPFDGTATLRSAAAHGQETSEQASRRLVEAIENQDVADAISALQETIDEVSAQMHDIDSKQWKRMEDLELVHRIGSMIEELFRLPEFSSPAMRDSLIDLIKSRISLIGKQVIVQSNNAHYITKASTPQQRQLSAPEHPETPVGGYLLGIVERNPSLPSDDDNLEPYFMIESRLSSGTTRIYYAPLKDIQSLQY